MDEKPLLAFIITLLIIIVKTALNPFSQDDVTVVKNSGKANMEMVIKQGEKIERYKASDTIGQDEGNKAGVVYRMTDVFYL
ncbi:MAG: DUF2149 domain-containing protein [Methylococcales bacterium]|nr:DUF2149 domain-containing protein [Methylococcales bacterium]